MPTPRSLPLLAGAVVLALVPAAPAAASHDVTPARIGGEDRFATAAEIALEAHPDGADRVLLASGATYPDALAGAPLASAWDAPVLLTAPDDVPDVTMAALSELEPEHITVLGGPDAVSEDAEAQASQGARAETDRVEGDTRYHTAAAITRATQQATDNAANWPGGQRAAFVTTGENFPDALAASALAAREGSPVPVLLTLPDAVPAPTDEAIEDLDIDLAVIVGGDDAVSAGVEAHLDDDDTTTDRVAGDTRTETATALADYAIEYLDFDASDLELARGDTFPDALTIAPLAGSNHDPILLTATPTDLSDETRSWLATTCDAVERIRAVGLDAAIAPSTLEDAETTAEQCHREGRTEQDVLVTPQEMVGPLDPGDSYDEISAATRHDRASDRLVEPLDVFLFPCDSVLEPTDGDFRFADGNADGNADGIESTNEGDALITEINGRATSTRGERDVVPNAEGRIDVTVHSDAPDCAAIVFFDDENNDSALNVDAEGYPVEAWGFTQVSWA